MLAADAVEHDLGTFRVPKLTGGVSVHGTATAESDPVALEVGKLYRLSGWIRTDTTAIWRSHSTPTNL